MANKPTHIAHSVRDFAKKDGEEDSPWTRIGAGFVHKDGQGLQYRACRSPVVRPRCAQAQQAEAEQGIKPKTGSHGHDRLTRPDYEHGDRPRSNGTVAPRPEGLLRAQRRQASILRPCPAREPPGDNGGTPRGRVAIALQRQAQQHLNRADPVSAVPLCRPNQTELRYYAFTAKAFKTRCVAFEALKAERPAK